MYRLGWTFASLLAKIGIPLLIKVDIIHDNEANVYIATSYDLRSLVVEADTLDELEKEVLELVPELLAAPHYAPKPQRIYPLASLRLQ